LQVEKAEFGEILDLLGEKGLPQECPDRILDFMRKLSMMEENC
jgi:hypothetical protein